MYKELDENRYIEQWGRVNRWYSKLEQIEQGNIGQSDPKELLDFVYAFFINCFHLKDWLPKNIKIKAENSLFDKKNGIFDMKLCADIANGVKHFDLDDRARILNKNLSVSGETRQSVTIFVGTSLTKYSWKIDNIEFYNLAKNCITEWNKFLVKENLI